MSQFFAGIMANVASPLNSKIIANHSACWSGSTVNFECFQDLFATFDRQRSCISRWHIPLWWQPWITNLFKFHSSWLLYIKEVQCCYTNYNLSPQLPSFRWKRKCRATCPTWRQSVGIFAAIRVGKAGLSTWCSHQDVGWWVPWIQVWYPFRFWSSYDLSILL